MPLEIHKSARKHYRRDRLTDEMVLHAAAYALFSTPMDKGDYPRRWLMVGVDPSGRLLELITLVVGDGREIIIHAMKARSKYLGGF